MTQHPSVSLANIGVGMPGCFVSKSYDGGRAGTALSSVANLKLRSSRFGAAFPSLKTLCALIPLALAISPPIENTFGRHLLGERAALYVIDVSVGMTVLKPMSLAEGSNGGKGQDASGGQAAAKPPLSTSSSGRPLPAVPPFREIHQRRGCDRTPSWRRAR